MREYTTRQNDQGSGEKSESGEWGLKKGKKNNADFCISKIGRAHV